MKCEGEILRQHVTELEKLNSALEENNKFLQYELTKSRAQAAGLERICENSRKQFEEIARGIREVETNNQALKSQTHVLEQSLVDFKKLNAELLKREKLTQFEIEKNLDQIRDLEDIYGVFRSRLERLGISEEDLVRD
jgi:chromosome segregation ATPase